jgi:dTDP-4-dehydrorhamnose 3,5-epimerase
VKAHDTTIPGVRILDFPAFADARGGFVKSFHAPDFEGLGLRTDWREEYFTTSAKNVVRGMHFQTPPAHHAKLVFCVAGRVLDVVLDIRTQSPTFGQAFSIELEPRSGVGLYVPVGCAHGFLSLTDDSVMYYKVTSVHVPKHDRGIAWDSFGFNWPVTDPVLSARDGDHPALAGFASPFQAVD